MRKKEVKPYLHRSSAVNHRLRRHNHREPPHQTKQNRNHHYPKSTSLNQRTTITEPQKQPATTIISLTATTVTTHTPNTIESATTNPKSPLLPPISLLLPSNLSPRRTTSNNHHKQNPNHHPHSQTQPSRHHHHRLHPVATIAPPTEPEANHHRTSPSVRTFSLSVTHPLPLLHRVLPSPSSSPPCLPPSPSLSVTHLLSPSYLLLLRRRPSLSHARPFSRSVA